MTDIVEITMIKVVVMGDLTMTTIGEVDMTEVTEVMIGLLVTMTDLLVIWRDLSTEDMTDLPPLVPSHHRLQQLSVIYLLRHLLDPMSSPRRLLRILHRKNGRNCNYFPGQYRKKNLQLLLLSVHEIYSEMPNQ